MGKIYRPSATPAYNGAGLTSVGREVSVDGSQVIPSLASTAGITVKRI